MKSSFNKGVAWAPVLVIVGLIILGGGAYLMMDTNSTPDQSSGHSRTHEFSITGSYSIQQDSYLVEFGDGQNAPLKCETWLTTEPVCTKFETVVHTYASTGTYQARVVANTRAAGNNTYATVQTYTVVIQ